MNGTAYERRLLYKIAKKTKRLLDLPDGKRADNIMGELRVLLGELEKDFLWEPLNAPKKKKPKEQK